MFTEFLFKPDASLCQETCTLQYNSATYDYRIYGFEMMVEDFARRPVTLTYSDGSQSVRAPPTRWKRQATWYYPTATSATTTAESTTATSATTASQWNNGWWRHVPAATTTAPASSSTSASTSISAPFQIFSSNEPFSKLPLHFSLLGESDTNQTLLHLVFTCFLVTSFKLNLCAKNQNQKFF